MWSTNKFREEFSYHLLELLYKQFKRISNNYYIDGRMNEKYERLKRIITYVEKNMELNYICDTSIKNKKTKSIELHIMMQQFYIECTKEEILDSIVSDTRNKLSNGEDFDAIDVTDKCYISSKYVREACDELHAYCEIIKIEPGYDNKVRLFNGEGFHYFNIVNIYGTKYIVDCTYKQFFKTNKSSLERLGVPLLWAPYPGTFMTLSEERKKVADTILKQGWIEATDENLKHYLDGFTLSFRNGLYYEKNGISYDTSYTIDDYKKFIYTEDSQIRREGIEILGIQEKPLQDYKLQFKK